MCIKRCQDLQPINFVTQWTTQELTVQSSGIFSVFLRVPIPSLKHSVQQREVHIANKVNVNTDFLQLSSTDWNWALSGQGLYWRSCFHGLPWPLYTAFTLLAKEKGSWYDTCSFFYRHTALETGTDISRFSYERLKQNMPLNQGTVSCNWTLLCEKMCQGETLRWIFAKQIIL